MNYLLKYKLITLCMSCCLVLTAQAQTIFSVEETIQTPQTQSILRYGNNPVDIRVQREFLFLSILIKITTLKSP